MIDPITPAALVPWRGKTYDLQLRNGGLAKASGELGIPILEGGEGSLFTKPEFYQRGVLLYAILRQKFDAVDLDECMDAVTGEKAEYYGQILAGQLRELIPAIRRLQGHTDEPARPTIDASSGEDSGPALASTSE